MWGGNEIGLLHGAMQRVSLSVGVATDVGIGSTGITGASGRSSRRSGRPVEIGGRSFRIQKMARGGSEWGRRRETNKNESSTRGAEAEPSAANRRAQGESPKVGDQGSSVQTVGPPAPHLVWGFESSSPAELALGTMSSSSLQR